jgi:hypothetical protein
MSDSQNEQAMGAEEVLAQVFQAFTTGNLKVLVDMILALAAAVRNIKVLWTARAS